MKRRISFDGWTRCFVFRVGLLAPLAGVLWFGLAVAAGSLLVPETAMADTALFRIEQRWHNLPNPRVTTPGGAGMDQGYLQPYTARTKNGEYLYPPPTAVVAPGNPIGGAFTLPAGFINVTGTYSLTPKTAWPGHTPKTAWQAYTTFVYVDYYNGPGKFQPNFGSTASNLRLAFPTTGLGSPLTPTTTFDGRYDMSRSGSITVTPGPNRFGGTFRLFHGPSAGWKQYIDYFSPALYQAYGYYLCFDDGMYDCTPDTFASEPGTTANYLGVWWLLTEKGRAKATTPTAPRAATKPTPTPYGNASYLRRSRHHLNLIHPWTTGFARAARVDRGSYGIFPQASGYDTSLGDADITVTHYEWNLNFNKTLSTFTTTTQTTKQYLIGVTRVVSMVRPRLVWTFAVPLDLSVDPIENVWSPARMWRLKVFFLPEPAGVLMLSAGIAALLGLSRMRRC